MNTHDEISSINLENKEAETVNQANKFAQMKNFILTTFNKENFNKLINKPYGVMLVAGLPLILMALVIVAIISMAHGVHHSKVTGNQIQVLDQQTNQAESLYHDINQLTQAINTNNHLTQNEINQLTQQVQALQLRAQQLSNQSDVKQIAQSLNDSSQLLSQKITQLESNVKEVKQVLQPHDFIDAKNLPFNVISVDIWNGTPYATVAIDGENELMGINETRSGWTVDSMDFATRQIIFRNNKDQFIKIQLEN